MSNRCLFLAAAFIITLSSCSGESLKRTGYETLQNVQRQQCQEDLSSECPEPKRYEVYQDNKKKLEASP